MTDQQRYDTIGALGFPHMHTPHLDRLIREGVSFDQCYCTAPSCVPSRASLFNLQYPHTLRVYNNQCAWDRSWVERLQEAGYHTVNVGKMHTVPLDAPCGFDQRFVVENKTRLLWLEHPHGSPYDEWDKFFNSSGVRKPDREVYRNEHPEWDTALGAFIWPIEDRFHPDIFVGNMAKWFIEQRKSESPLFLQIGFPGPHPPYDPTASHLKRYEKMDLPLPEVTEEELAGQPPPHAALRREFVEGNHDAVRWHEHPTREQLLRLRRYYAANVTLIDEQIGDILDQLQKRGYLDNSIVVFLSDHGDNLGDHGHIQKWTMYDTIMRMPAIVRAPATLPGGHRVNGLLQQMDLVPMIFELAGLDARPSGAPAGLRWAAEPRPPGAAISALPVATGEDNGREVVFAEHSADRLLREVEFITMARTREWKLVHYLGQEWGELYDLQNDPGETKNLWRDSSCKETRQHLLEVIRDWRIRGTL